MQRRTRRNMDNNNIIMDVAHRQARSAAPAPAPAPLPALAIDIPRRAHLPRDDDGSGSGYGSGSGSGPSGSQPQSYDGDDGDGDGDDGDDDGDNGPIYPPLVFTCALDHVQTACKDVLLTFTGGCKPYSLSALWFTDASNHSDTTWVKLKEQTWDNSFQWNILAPVSSSLLFSLTDAKGSTITSEDAIIVKSNERGYAADTWCQYVYASKPVPAAATNSNNRYAWNGTNNNNNNAAVSTSTLSSSGSLGSSRKASSTSPLIDVDATDLSDRSTTIAKAIHDADAAKVIEGVLAAMLCTSLIALGALLFFFLRLRRRLRDARAQLSARQLQNGANGHGQQPLMGVMSEKPGESRYSPTDMNNSGQITPRAGLMGRVRSARNGNSNSNNNPFDNPALNNNALRTPFLGVPTGTPGGDRAAATERNRLSTTSLVSAVPSHGARSTAADSTLSTEFYHTYKASTIPPKLFDAIDRARNGGDPGGENTFSSQPPSASTSGGGRLRGLFAPMSFFSSATPSPATSASSRMRGAPGRTSASASASSTAGMTDDRSSDGFYDDGRSIDTTSIGGSSRPDAPSRSTSAETVQVPITRVSTRSDTSSSSSAPSSNFNTAASSRLAPPSTPSMRSSGRSSGNGADESSIQGDVYDDSDAASFSNFSFVDTGSSFGAAGRMMGDEQDIDDDTNPFADKHAHESSEDENDDDEGQSTLVGMTRSSHFFSSASASGSGSAVSAPRGGGSRNSSSYNNNNDKAANSSGTGTGNAVNIAAGEYKRKSWTRAPTDFYNTSKQQAGESSVGLTGPPREYSTFSTMMGRSNSSLFDDADSEVDLSSTPRNFSR